MNKRNIDVADVERMERQLACLRNMGMVLESTMELDEVLSRTVEQITQLCCQRMNHVQYVRKTMIFLQIGGV